MRSAHCNPSQRFLLTDQTQDNRPDEGNLLAISLRFASTVRITEVRTKGEFPPDLPGRQQTTVQNHTLTKSTSNATETERARPWETTSTDTFLDPAPTTRKQKVCDFSSHTRTEEMRQEKLGYVPGFPDIIRQSPERNVPDAGRTMVRLTARGDTASRNQPEAVHSIRRRHMLDVCAADAPIS